MILREKARLRKQVKELQHRLAHASEFTYIPAVPQDPRVGPLHMVKILRRGWGYPWVIARGPAARGGLWDASASQWASMATVNADDAYGFDTLEQAEAELPNALAIQVLAASTYLANAAKRRAEAPEDR